MLAYQLETAEPTLILPAGFRYYYLIENLGPNGILIAPTAASLEDGIGILIPGCADPYGENGDATPPASYYEDNHPYDAVYGLALVDDQVETYDTRVKVTPAQAL